MSSVKHPQQFQPMTKTSSRNAIHDRFAPMIGIADPVDAMRAAMRDEATIAVATVARVVAVMVAAKDGATIAVGIVDPGVLAQLAMVVDGHRHAIAACHVRRFRRFSSVARK